MDGGERWLNFLEESTDEGDVDAIVIAVYAFNVTALKLMDEMERGKQGLETQLGWFKKVDAKRTTRSAKAGKDSNIQEAYMPANLAESSLWLRFETTDEYIFAKSLSPHQSVYWPARVLNALDTETAHELLSLNLKVLVPVDCCAKSARVRLVRSSDCLEVGKYKLDFCLHKRQILR